MPATTRRQRLALPAAVTGVAALVVVVLLAGGVALHGSRWWPGTPRPAERFTGYTLRVTGGIAGVYREVRVGADGTALFLDDRPVAGRLPAADLRRARELATSTELAVEARDDPSGSTRCGDAFTYTVLAGDLVVSREDCGDGLAGAPALSGLLRLADRDRLRPLPAGTPAGRTAVVARDGDPAGRVTVRVDAAGRVATSGPGSATKRSRLTGRTYDAWRLLLAGPLPVAAADRCPAGPGYRLRIDGRDPFTARTCGGGSQVRLAAVLAVVEATTR